MRVTAATPATNARNLISKKNNNNATKYPYNRLDTRRN